jgi:hypothetical protein
LIVVKNETAAMLLTFFLCSVPFYGQTSAASVQSISVPERPAPSEHPALEGLTQNVDGVRPLVAPYVPNAQTGPTSTKNTPIHRSHHLRNILIITAAGAVLLMIQASFDK